MKRRFGKYLWVKVGVVCGIEYVIILILRVLSLYCAYPVLCTCAYLSLFFLLCHLHRGD